MPDPNRPSTPALPREVLSRQRRFAMALTAILLAIGFVLFVVNGDGVALGPFGLLAVVGATLLVGIGAVCVLAGRRRAIVRNVRASGQLDGALWSTGAQMTPSGRNALEGVHDSDPAQRRPGFTTGVLALVSGDLRFIPGPRDRQKGHRPWSVPLHNVVGAETTLPLMDRFGGRYLYFGLCDGAVVEFVGDGRGLQEACRAARIPFA